MIVALKNTVGVWVSESKEKVDTRLFLFIVAMSVLKFLIFRMFSENVALFSVDFIAGNLLVATLTGRYRKGVLFFFNSLFFLVFIILSFSSFFHFSIRSLLDSLKFYKQINLVKYIGTFVLLAAALLTIGGLIKFILKGNRKKASLHTVPFYLSFLALIYILQSVVFTDRSKFTNISHTSYKKTFYLFDKGDIVTMVLEDKSFAFGFGLKNKVVPLVGDKRSAFASHSVPESKSQIFALIESLGKFNGGAWQTMYADSMQKWVSGKGYELVVDSVPFEGATVDGELRELFSLKGDYNTLLNTNKEYPTLFSDLKQKGYKTYSVSSSSGKVFSDRLIYGKAGCEKSIFKEDMVALPDFDADKYINQESAFSGVKDEYSFDYLLSSVFTKGDTAKKAAYFLTINSHLPFTLNETVAKSAEFKAFKARYEKDYDNEVLEHAYKLLTELRYFVQKSMENNIDNVVFVGDHSPPFFKPSQRAYFSQTHVPVYVLRKKSS